MKNFMDENFLLSNEPAKKLFFEYAKDMPIFDYHCHLIPAEIEANKRFDSITEAWLGGDHYKWRAMRASGFSEREPDPYKKFLSWAKTIETLIGNPLYHWTHLELQRYFDINEPLTQKSAKEIYDTCNKKLSTDPTLDVFGIFKKFNVYAVGTTDDPVDSLEHHAALKGKIDTKVIPSFRPDKALNIDQNTYVDYIQNLAKSANMEIKSAEDVLTALIKRLDFFISLGCRATDHALTNVPFKKASVSEVNQIFSIAMEGNIPSPKQIEIYKTFMYVGLAKAYKERNIAMQLHIACIRNNNKKAFMELGPDTGYDAVLDANISENLSALLNEMHENDGLPKTILYSLNPKDYYPLATLMGCFQEEMPGKMQLGSGWWFCDHIDGMTDQMKILGNLGVLARFIGMLTDSRSFLSYSRHEYFRRILCNLIGTWVENGEVAPDYDVLGRIVSDICFNNAKNYFEN